MKTFITHDIFKLFSNANHFILPFKCQHHGKTGIKKYSFHDNIISDKIKNKTLDILGSFGAKVGVKNGFCNANDKIILFFDAWNAVIHIVNFIRIKPERIIADLLQSVPTE